MSCIKEALFSRSIVHNWSSFSSPVFGSLISQVLCSIWFCKCKDGIQSSVNDFLFASFLLFSRASLSPVLDGALPGWFFLRPVIPVSFTSSDASTACSQDRLGNLWQ